MIMRTQQKYYKDIGSLGQRALQRDLYVSKTRNIFAIRMKRDP